jgi:hypothetical protein
VAVLDQGRLLDCGAVPELLERHGGPSILEAQRAGGTNRRETTDPMGELLRLHAEGPLAAFTVRPPDLEQVFLRLTGRRLRD